MFDETEVRSYYLTLSAAEYAKLMELSTLLLGRTTVNEDRYVEVSQRLLAKVRRSDASAGFSPTQRSERNAARAASSRRTRGAHGCCSEKL